MHICNNFILLFIFLSIHKREKERHEPPPSTTTSSHGRSSSPTRPPKQPQAPKVTGNTLFNVHDYF